MEGNLTALAGAWRTGTVYPDGVLSAYAVTADANSPVLAVAPGALTFSATVGGAFPPPANLSVSNSGSGSLSFTAVANQAWLQLNPLSGTVPNNIQVSAVTAGLSAGTYTGQITVSGSSGTTKTVSATLPLIPTRGRSACQWPGWGVTLHLDQKSSGEYDCYNYGNA